MSQSGIVRKERQPPKQKIEMEKYILSQEEELENMRRDSEKNCLDLEMALKTFSDPFIEIE